MSKESKKKCCWHCRKIYIALNPDSKFCSDDCKGEYIEQKVDAEEEREAKGEDFDYYDLDGLFRSLAG